MTAGTSNKPTRCAICGYYLTLTEEYLGSRCLAPGHWQAAGRVASTDFLGMARVMAAEHRERSNQQFSFRFGSTARTTVQFVISALMTSRRNSK